MLCTVDKQVPQNALVQCLAEGDDCMACRDVGDHTCEETVARESGDAS